MGSAPSSHIASCNSSRSCSKCPGRTARGRMPTRSASSVSSTPARQLRRYRWTILSAGVVAQAAFSAILLGLPAIAPAIQDQYELSLTDVGVVLAALNFGSLATLLVWG